ncbi:MAG TPA: ABC transporter permease [Catenuloplanes sp.]
MRPARLGPGDLLRLGSTGLRSRPLRVFLSALGIAIGVAAMIAVVGISVSSSAQVNRQLDKLGTNMLRVSPGKDIQDKTVPLPAEAVQMIDRIPPVQQVAATAEIETHIYRNDHIPSGRTGSIAVLAAGPDLPATVGARLHAGSWFAGPTTQFPAVVLGAAAADRLDARTPGVRLWLGGQWCVLLGVLDPVPLAPEIDNAALVSWQAARTYLRFDGHPTTVYVRAAEEQVTAVQAVLGRTARPDASGTVQVSRPSDALAARQVTNSALTGLLLGLGGVALLVGGIGVGNTMIISVLERRSEIGLRRSLGATRGQIRGQFVAESLLLSLIGGVGGVLLGTAVTAVYAVNRGWPIVVPPWISLGGVGITLIIGALAGLYPAVRASRLSPTEALTAP